MQGLNQGAEIKISLIPQKQKPNQTKPKELQALMEDFHSPLTGWESAAPNSRGQMVLGTGVKGCVVLGEKAGTWVFGGNRMISESMRGKYCVSDISR